MIRILRRNFLASLLFPAIPREPELALTAGERIVCDTLAPHVDRKTRVGPRLAHVIHIGNLSYYEFTSYKVPSEARSQRGEPHFPAKIEILISLGKSYGLIDGEKVNQQLGYITGIPARKEA